MLDELSRSASGPLSESLTEILQSALFYAEYGDWGRAAEILRGALEDEPDQPYLLCWLGLVERELGLKGVAYERFKRALVIGSEDPVLLSIAGTAVAAFDDPTAEAALRTAAVLAPDLPEARWRYGAYLAREGMLEDALSELSRAVELDPEDPVIQLEMGVAHSLMGDLDAAYRCFAQSVELDPGNGWGLILLGLTALQSGDLSESLRALDEGARVRPDDIEAQLLAALVLCAEGWEERALEMLERGRIAASDLDHTLLDQTQTEIENGPEAALEMLRDTLAPSSFRERLMQRP